MAAKKTLPTVKMRNKAKLLDDLPIQSAPINAIQLPAIQPRRYFDSDKMAQLVESVRSLGILEPLLVRPLSGGQFELVAGERRLRAASEVGLDTVPIVSKDFTDTEALQVALLENLQREDLNPIEETEGVLDLLAITLEVNRNEVISIIHRSKNAKVRGRELNHNVMVQFETIERTLMQVGKFSVDSFRSNRLPLLALPKDILDALRQGKLEYTKAIAISRLKNDTKRSKFLEEAIESNLSLGQIRSKIQALNPPKTPTRQAKVIERYTQLGKRLKKANMLQNTAKRKRLNDLLSELEELLEDSDAKENAE